MTRAKPRQALRTPELPPHAVAGLLTLLRRFRRILEADGGSIATCTGVLRARDVTKALKKAGLEPGRKK